MFLDQPEIDPLIAEQVSRKQGSQTTDKSKLVYITTIPSTQYAFLRGQNLFLASKGFDIHAVSSPGPKLEALAVRDNVSVHPIEISRQIAFFKDFVSLARLSRLIYRLRPDILHLSTPKAALLGAVAGWMTRCPIRIFYVRGSITENASGARRKLYRWIEKLTARLCNRTVCVSESLLHFLREEGILGPGEGAVLAKGMSNGIDIKRFDPSLTKNTELLHRKLSDEDLSQIANLTVIGFVGRLAYDKGIEDLLDAWKNLRDRYPSSVLLIVGSWEKENPVSASARVALETDPRVLLTGRVEDVEQYLRLMDVFVFPSHGTEGFPNAPMEAAAMELPVIATRVIGSIDAVDDGETGLLVPARDAGALAEALRVYLDDPDLRRRHGRAGRERVLRNFRREVIWEAVYQEYVGLLRQRGLAVPESPVEAILNTNTNNEVMN